MGASPTHPKLLDWLAVEFVGEGDAYTRAKGPFIADIVRLSTSIAVLTSPVGCGCASINRGNDNKGGLRLQAKDDPIRSHATTEADRIGFELLEVARKGIASHLIERRDNAFTISTRKPLYVSLRPFGDL